MMPIARAEREQEETKAQTELEKKVLEGLRVVDAAERTAIVDVVQAEADAVS